MSLFEVDEKQRHLKRVEPDGRRPWVKRLARGIFIFMWFVNAVFRVIGWVRKVLEE